jgi:hypothetical protein
MMRTSPPSSELSGPVIAGCNAHEQDEHEVVQRELADLALPKKAERDQERGVDNHAPHNQLEHTDRRR